MCRKRFVISYNCMNDLLLHINIGLTCVLFFYAFFCMVNIKPKRFVVPSSAFLHHIRLCVLCAFHIFAFCFALIFDPMILQTQCGKKWWFFFSPSLYRYLPFHLLPYYTLFLYLSPPFIGTKKKKSKEMEITQTRKESTWKLACKGIWDHLMCSCLAKIIKMWFYLWNSTLCSIGLAFASCIVHFKHSWSQYITMIAFGSAWVRYVCRYSFRSVGNSHWMIFSFFLLRKLFCSKRNFKFKISTNQCKRANGLTIWKQWSRSWALLLRINAKCAQWNRISTNPNMISVAFLSFNCARFDGFMCFMPYDRRFTLC